MSNKAYSTPNDFKRALEERLRKSITPNRDLNRVRQLLIFDRFLARIALEFQDAVVLKGGLVLELRLRAARMTNDVDIRFSGDPERLLVRLQQAGRINLLDFMDFEVTLDRKHPAIQGEAAKYDGKRFWVVCKIANIIYGRPRDRPNSRVKDLPDMALLSRLSGVRAELLHQAFVQTFTFRATHELPATLPAPPPSWPATYAQTILDYDLEWRTLDACHDRAARFIDPVLAGNHTSTWDPASGEWQ